MSNEPSKMKANDFAIIFTGMIIFRIFLTKIVSYIPDPIAIKVNIVVASPSSTRSLMFPPAIISERIPMIPLPDG